MVGGASAPAHAGCRIDEAALRPHAGDFIQDQALARLAAEQGVGPADDFSGTDLETFKTDVLAKMSEAEQTRWIAKFTEALTAQLKKAKSLGLVPELDQDYILIPTDNLDGSRVLLDKFKPAPDAPKPQGRSLASRIPGFGLVRAVTGRATATVYELGNAGVRFARATVRQFLPWRPTPGAPEVAKQISGNPQLGKSFLSDLVKLARAENPENLHHFYQKYSGLLGGLGFKNLRAATGPIDKALEALEKVKSVNERVGMLALAGEDDTPFEVLKDLAMGADPESMMFTLALGTDPKTLVSRMVLQNNPEGLRRDLNKIYGRYLYVLETLHIVKDTTGRIGQILISGPGNS